LLLCEIQKDQILLDNIDYKKHHDILNKIWNASRFIYKSYIEDKDALTIDYILKRISTDITEYDNWILHEIKNLLDEFDYKISENKLLGFLKKLLNFCNEILCERYIESLKISQDINTPYVAIFAFSMIFKLLEPYLPLFTNNIESKFSIDTSNYNIFDFKTFELKEKNYKVNLLMDIVESFKQMKSKLNIKKHQSIDVFIQSNPEFESFLSQNIDVLKSLININNIDSISFHENIPI
jgi:valyl-tRNA synthetase